MSLFKHDNPLFVVLDIGSASVGGALLECNPHPKLLFSIREHIPFREEFNKTRFLSDILHAERKVLAELAKMSTRSPETIHVVISSPWYIGQSRTRLQSYAEETLVTRELLNKLEKEEIVAFGKEATMLHPNIFGDGYSILELRNTGIKVNGYKTSTPEGERAKSLELSFFVSLISEEVKNLFKETAVGTWNHSNIVFHSHPVALTHVLEMLYPGPDSYLIFDVLGEVTDVLTVRDHMVKDTASIPLGSHHFVREATKALGTVSEEVLSLVHGWNTGALDGKRKENFGAVVGTFRDTWLAQIREIFEKLARELLLPEKAYIVGSNDLSQLFAEFLKDEKLVTFSAAGAPINVIHISTESVCQFCDIEKGARDPLLGLEGLYISRVKSAQSN